MNNKNEFDKNYGIINIYLMNNSKKWKWLILNNDNYNKVKYKSN